MKPKLSLSLTRPNGHASKATIAGDNLEPEMMAIALRLLEYMTTGEDPGKPCKTCGHPRVNHSDRHPFVD